MSWSEVASQPQYLVARLQQVLAEDPRTAELGLRITIRGDQVYLSGSVASSECKAELSRVLHEAEPSMGLHNEVRVVEAGEPAQHEVLP